MSSIGSDSFDLFSFLLFARDTFASITTNGYEKNDQLDIDASNYKSSGHNSFDDSSTT
jgi:hypothetical protein